MKTLARSLQDYPPAMLRAIAETTGVALTSNVARRMVEELADFLSHPGRLDALVAACSPAAREALAVLLRAEGRSLRLAFERQYGVIRAMGPGRLERERPHLAPINPSEELWYRGLIYSAFAETPAGMAEFLYIPGDIASLLPPPEPALAGLRVPACPTARCRSTCERFSAARHLHVALPRPGRRGSSRRWRRPDFVAAHFSIRAKSHLVAARPPTSTRAFVTGQALP